MLSLASKPNAHWSTWSKSFFFWISCLLYSKCRLTVSGGHREIAGKSLSADWMLGSMHNTNPWRQCPWRRQGQSRSSAFSSQSSWTTINLKSLTKIYYSYTSLLQFTILLIICGRIECKIFILIWRYQYRNAPKHLNVFAFEKGIGLN